MFTYFIAEFTYSDESISEKTKDIMEKLYCELRGEAVDLLNPHLEEWNAAYGKEVHGEDDMEYNAYIQNKEKAILSEVNKKHNDLLWLYADEYADIVGKFVCNGKIITMHMSLKPIV